MASFPILKTPELVSSLHEIGNNLSADDIDRPSSAKVIPAYLWFWTHLTMQTLDDVRMAAALYLENNNLQDTSINTDEAATQDMAEAVYMGVLWQTLNQMMRWAMIDDFSIRDLRDPQATRVRRILSGLTNFHLFEVEQSQFLASLDEEFEREEEARHQSSLDLDDITRKIADKKAQMEKDGVRVAQLAKENAERRNKLIRAKEMEDPALQRLDAVKRTKTILQEKIDTETMSYKQHEAEINRLRSKIVQSPDRVRRTLNDMANSLQSLKDEIVEIDRKAREHEARVSVAKKYEGDISSVIKLLDEWFSELTKCRATTDKLSVLIETRDRSMDTLRELDLRLQQLSRRSTTTSEALSRHDQVSSQKKESVRVRMVKLQELYESIMQERSETQAQLDSKNKEIRSVEEAMVELSRTTDAELDRVEAAYKELRNDVLTYSAKLNKALDSLNATIAKPYEG